MRSVEPNIQGRKTNKGSHRTLTLGCFLGPASCVSCPGPAPLDSCLSACIVSMHTWRGKYGSLPFPSGSEPGIFWPFSGQVRNNCFPSLHKESRNCFLVLFTSKLPFVCLSVCLVSLSVFQGRASLCSLGCFRNNSTG